MKAFGQNIRKRWVASMLAVAVACQQLVYAQEAYTPGQAPTAAVPSNPPPGNQAYSQPQLDQMLAPIALYPDQLLSQVLMASTYPLEVVEAARWSRANSDVRGDDAVKAVQQRDWDPSVKSLVAFPRILQMMDEKLEWTESLGEAFLAQQAQVMDTIQNLRQKAYAAGNLNSSDQVRVETQGQNIVVVPASPDIIYVPYYDPTVVYGTWWWPAYPPVYWPPWPGYVAVSGFAWGVGIFVTTGFFFGNCDWPRRRVDIVNVHNFYYPRAVPGRREHRPVTGPWRHDPVHRRGAPYHDRELRRKYGAPSESPEFRRNFPRFGQPSPSPSAPGKRVAPPAGGKPAAPEPGIRRETRRQPQGQAGPGIQPGREAQSARPAQPGREAGPEGRRRVPQPSAGPQPRTEGSGEVRRFESAPPTRQGAPSGGFMGPPAGEPRRTPQDGLGRGAPNLTPRGGERPEGTSPRENRRPEGQDRDPGRPQGGEGRDAR